VKNKIVPVHAVKAYGGNTGIAPFILNVGTKWRGDIKSTQRLLYPTGKNPGAYGIGFFFVFVLRREKFTPPWIPTAARSACCLVAISTMPTKILPVGAVFAVIARFVQ
jgi:hypothetical protein